MKQNSKEKWIVDERQEMKGLQNSKTAWTLMIVLLGASVWIQGFILHRDSGYYMPEIVILLIGCIVNIILNIKDGVLYTKENANRKSVWILYIGTSVLCGTVVSVMSFIRYDVPWYVSVASGLFLAAFMLGAILALDVVSTAFTKRRIAKQDQELDREEEL